MQKADLLKERKDRFLRPVTKYLYTPFHTEMLLYRMLQLIAPGKWSYFDIASAYDLAVHYDKGVPQEIQKALYQSYKSKNRERY